jgi:DegV family protein with EDD domain
MAVAVITDSVSDLPSDVAEELGITIIPFHVHIGRESYLDDASLDMAEFYHRMEMGGADYPRTSMPNLYEFVTVYSELAKKTNEIISINLSAGIDATCNTAMAAAAEVENCRIEVVDSGKALMGTGLLAIEAAKAAEEGMNLAQLADMVRKLVPRCHTLMTCDSAKYLVQGGHASETLKVLLGKALRIKPLIELKGQILPFGKAIGHVRAINALYEYVSSFPHPRSLAVDYSTNAKEAESFAKRLGEMFPGVPIYTGVISPVVGAHTGPGTLAVSMIEE